MVTTDVANRAKTLFEKNEIGCESSYFALHAPGAVTKQLNPQEGRW